MLFEKIQLETEEKIVLIVRKHWFFITVRAFGLCVSALLPLLAWLFLTKSPTLATFNTINLIEYVPHFVFLYSAWLLLHWIFLAYAWTDHYLDLWALTDRRLITVDQVSLFDRHIGSFRLERLQDMNIEITGIVATLLNYGTIEAQTASGGEEEFRAHYLPKPREFKAAILKAADQRLNKRDMV